jgi:hypothetical protein
MANNDFGKTCKFNINIRVLGSLAQVLRFKTFSCINGKLVKQVNGKLSRHAL